MIITELGRGKYSDCFKVEGPGGHAVAAKVSYYREATIRAFARHARNGDRGLALTAKDQDAISVAMAMAVVAKQMKACGVSPHFVRVFCEADARHLPLRLQPLLRERLAHLSANQIKYSHVCIMELYSCTLSVFLTRVATSDATIRALLFQVVYTLACLQAVLPGFRHNDLSANNVLIKRSKHACMRYTALGMTFCVCCKVTPALADFDFTHVPGHEVLSNERVLGGRYGITPEVNSSYDVHLLLHSVLKCLRRSGRCPEAQAFIAGLRLTDSDRTNAHMPHLTPARLLAHAYFGCLRCAPDHPAQAEASFALPA